MNERVKKCVMGLLLVSLFSLDCNKKSTEPEQEIIPLDGRGGGVIAYCYQPITGEFDHQIYAINADGSGNIRLIQADIGLNHHDWSPDGQRLAAVGYVNSSTWSIYVFNADGTQLTRLTTTNLVNDSEPNWSPDGAQIVFTRIYPNQNDRTEIWVMDADGGNQRYIGVEGFAAKWSPDGSQFVYQSSLRESSDLYTCNVDGSNVQQLTATASTEINPVYSPDGTQIAYTTDRDGNYEIYIMNADGSNPQRLTNHAFDDYTPRWSSDGTLIAFNTGPWLEWEVYTIHADGTNMRQVTDSPANITAINPVWRPE